MIAFKVLVMFILILPAALIDAFIYILGVWTLPDYERPSVVYALMEWVDK